MGAWDYSVFSSDDGLDFVYDIIDKKEDFINLALDKVLETSINDYLDSDEALQALITLEIFAVYNKKESNKLPEDLKEWIKNNPNYPFRKNLNNIIDRILGDNSELKELWKETDKYGKWLEYINDLKTRIN